MSNRIIIIVWWWSSGSLSSPFDEWDVSNSSDKLLRVDSPYSPKSIELLQQLLHKQAVNNEVIIFFHRSHGYNDEAIKIISQSIEAQKVKSLQCFLFGEGSDQIYLTNNPRGLLGTKGSFVATYASGKQIDARENIKEQLVKKEHFDSIWNFYAHSFEQRIFEFSEDLFLGLTPLVSTSPIEKGLPYQLLRKPEHQLLLLRLLSFVGKIRTASRPENDLRQFEIQDKRSYSFSTLAQNLKTTYPAVTVEVFQSICHIIKSEILSGKESLNLKQLRASFSILLNSLKIDKTTKE